MIYLGVFMRVNNINELIKLLKIYMIENNKKQSDIWKTLNIKQANVSRTFSGKTNFSIQTLLDYVSALDGQIEINIVPKDKDNTIDNTDNTSTKDQ